LGGGGEEGIVSCAVRASQAQAIHPEDALEVCEQHLDLLALAARDEIGVSCGEITGALMGRTQDLACWLGRATARLESVGPAVELAGTVAQHAVLIDERPILAIDLLPLAQPLVGRADADIAVGDTGYTVQEQKNRPLIAPPDRDASSARMIRGKVGDRGRPCAAPWPLRNV